MMSTPSTISRFSDEASNNWGMAFAGRKLAKSPSSWRIASSPVSGLNSRGLPSHLGPPMAAIRMESAAWQDLRVSSGHGVPAASMAQPPSSCSS